MRCASFCSAESYQIDDFSKFLRSEGYEPKFYDDIIHIQKSSHNDESQIPSDAFFFPYGCLITWGMDEDEDQQMLSLVENFQHKPLDILVKDLSFYTISEDPTE